MLDLDSLDFAKGNGLVTVVVQEAISGSVLMVAHADRKALEQTLATGEMHFHSRSRGLWRKGATSGHIQQVVALLRDCDGDAIVARVICAGPACHTGSATCFGDTAQTGDVLSLLDATITSRGASAGSPVRDTKGSYTIGLLRDRNLRLKKIGEEAAELITACADEDHTHAAEETADVFYHALVALHAVGGSLTDVRRALAERAAATAVAPSETET